MKRISFVLMLIAMSCAQHVDQETQAESTELDSNSLAELPSTDLFSDGKSDLIKNANLRFQVVNLKKSREEINNAIRKFSGFIASADLKYENPVLEEHLTIRVLSLSFEPLLNEIEKQAAYINFRKINSDDVTKDFVDLESRLKSKREMEARYADIVRRKTNSTEDLMKAELEIGKLHEEIEAVVSRINFMRDQVRYSTIQLEIYQVSEQQAGIVSIDKPLGTGFSESFAIGWRGLTAILLLLAKLWPLIILGISGWYFAWHKSRGKAV